MQFEYLIEPKIVLYGGFSFFCIYQKNTFNPVTYLTVTIYLVHPVNFCLQSATRYRLVFLVYVVLLSPTKYCFLLNVVWEVVAIKTVVLLQP